MNAARLSKMPQAGTMELGRHWVASRSVSLLSPQHLPVCPSNDREPAELIRDQLSLAAVEAEDEPEAQARPQVRKLASIEEFGAGLAGAIAVVVMIACLLAP